jgi:LacI family transcriptional regulator
MIATTLRDIAARANVSTATVSRVLNDYPYVDNATRTQVLQIARELGYPSGTTRRGVQPRAVLLLIRDEASAGDSDGSLGARDFERAVSAGVQAVFEQQTIATRLQRTRMAVAEVAGYADDPSVAGLILLGGVVQRPFIEALQSASVPFVVAGAHALPLRVNCVMADVARATEEAIGHLVASGRRTIGLVNGPEETTTSVERMRGYRLALAEHGLEYRPDQVVRAEFRADAGHAATLQLLAQRPELDALLYPDDLVAMGGLSAIKASGRRVPADLAIIGFYDYDLARFTEPPLSSLHIDMQRIGNMAARRLQMMLDAPDGQDWLTLVEATLVLRAST